MDKVVHCPTYWKEKRIILLEEIVIWRKEKRSSFKLFEWIQMEELFWRCRTLENHPKRYHQDEIQLQILSRTIPIWFWRYNPSTSIINLYRNSKHLYRFSNKNSFHLSEKSSRRNLLSRHEWNCSPHLLLPD